MKDKQISIRLTADKHARLSTLAWLEHSPSAAALLTKIVEDALAKNSGRINTALALRSPESSTPQMTARPAEETTEPPVVERQLEDRVSALAQKAANITVEVVAQEPEGVDEDKPAPKKNAVDRENNIPFPTTQSSYSQNSEKAAV